MVFSKAKAILLLSLFLSGPTAIAEEVPLRQYVDAQMVWVDKYFDMRLAAMREAVDKAELQLSRRLEGMNEFRETLKDQAGRLATKEQLEIQVKNLDDRIKIIELGLASAEGRSNVTAVFWAIGASLLTTVISGFVISKLNFRKG